MLILVTHTITVFETPTFKWYGSCIIFNFKTVLYFELLSLHKL